MDRKYIRDVALSSSIDKQSYLCRLPIIKHFAEHKTIHFTKDVTFLVGENGTGKSTLLEAIAVAYGFNPEGGTKNFSFSTNQSHSELHEHLTLSRSAYAKDGFFLRAESFYNVASYIDDLDSQPAASPKLISSYGGKSMHRQSHGESFLSLITHRFGGNGLYLLDEPEAALSPTKLMVLMAEIHRLVNNNSQFIIATHSPMLMTLKDSEILEFSEDGIASIGYKETEHYQLTRCFLDNPEKMQKYLFKLE